MKSFLFSNFLSNFLSNEIVSQKSFSMIGFSNSIGVIDINQVSSIAPELFLILSITGIWGYMALGGDNRIAIRGLRYAFFTILFLYIYSMVGQYGVAANTSVAEMGLFILYSKMLIIVFGLPILWLIKAETNLVLYFGAIILFNFGLIGSKDMLSAYVCLEGLSLLSYGIIATNKTRGSAEAGLKYFLYGVVASALLVFGLSLLYLQCRELSWGDVYLFFAFDSVSYSIELQVISLLLILSALIYKLSLFPFHFTLPDVYTGSNWSTIAVINVGVKFGVVLFLFKLWNIVVVNSLVSGILAIILSGFAGASIVVGCFGALTQTSLKRFFAYTSINQSGFIIMGLLTNSLFGLEVSILYVAVYMLSLLLFVYAVDNVLSDDVAGVNNLKGINKLSMIVALFSMAGIPPLFGFGSKYFIWLSLFDSMHSGLVDWHSYAIEFLLITSIIVSLISAFYYLRLIKIASIKDQIIIRGGRSSEGEYIALGIVVFLTIWPLFINIFWVTLENYALANYGPWIMLF